MHILTDITLDFVSVGGKGYPRINILELNRPTTYHPHDFFLMERFSILRDNLDQLSNARKAEKFQAVLYYISGKVYMSSQIHMGGYDLFGDPKIYDLKDYIEKGIARLVDTETDTARYLYVYRIYYKNFGDVGSSSYRLGVEVGEIGGEASTDMTTGMDPGSGGGNPIMMGHGSLYKTLSDGTIVEKGVPMVHVTQRYRGPIEGPKEQARRTALLGTDEYLGESADDMYDTTEAFYGDITEFGNRIVASVSGVGVGALAPEFDYYMNPYLFMDYELWMNDGTA